MHAIKLLHNLLEEACQSIDKRLQRTLFLTAETLTRCKELSIFGLGRALASSADVKHNIKRVDRLLGNTALHTKHSDVYQGIAQLLLKNNKRPIIIIDWSGLTRCGAYHFLRAGVAVGGRTLTLYDQAYPLKKYMSDKTHKEFLKTLKNILPVGCRPILITDAGFRNTWFRAVKELGWDFIGRVRNNTQFKTATAAWKPIKTLYQQATQKACALGEVLLSYTRPLSCYFYLMKQKKKNRVKRNLVGKKVECSSSKKHERAAREPWLIASSLSPAEMSAKEVMCLYKKRMQIEEAFRDLKNPRNGFSLRHCRSFKVERLNIILLIAALGMLLLWVLGTAAKKRGLHYSFQANTEKRWNVLSNFIIGWQVLIRDNIRFSNAELLAALDDIIYAAS